MEKPVAVIEITSNSIKFVAGYELDGKVYVIYTLNKKIGNLVNNGRIIDMPRLVEEIKKISDVQDNQAFIHIKFSEAIVILPPCGLTVYRTSQISNTVSDVNKIGTVDVRNVYCLIRKSLNLTNDALVDIIADSYVLDQNRRFSRPPLGENSSTLSVEAKVHLLPNVIYNEYVNVFNSASLSVKRTVIAPFASAQILAKEENIPSKYVLVDIGSDMTTVSLIGGNQIFSSTSFLWGSDRINDALISKFNFVENDAEKYKCLYGLDNRKMNFDAPICTLINEDGSKTKVSHDEFNSTIKSQIDLLVTSLNSAIDQLSKDYNNPIAIKKLPMILIGGGSQLNGLKEYIEHKVPSDTVENRIPKTLGARNPGLYSCLGAVLVHATYPTVYDDSHPKVNQLTRNTKEKWG